MGPEIYFFEVPVYRLDRDKHYLDRDNFIEATISRLFPGPDRQLFEANQSRVVNLTDHLQMQYGGPWNFNEVIGFIRLYFLSRTYLEIVGGRRSAIKDA